ncbi:MAG TPA: carboxypeptidase-like regulatory domain-containing protein [Vicinamibacterales bacterium]|nr:carboxypeptidase-like regulatory domain-containing protein [Vicinamibacterales bacterium]
MTQSARRAMALLLCAAGVSHVLGAQSPGYPLPKGTNVLIGRVIDIGTDRPVAGAAVTLLGNFDENGKPVQALPRDASASTNAGKNVFTTSEGYFVFRELPAGRYFIAIRAFGYQNNDYPPNVVEVVESTSPASTELYVWKHGAIRGQVTDDKGDPVVGMPVYALRRQVIAGKVFVQQQSEGVTDDRGVYRISLLPPGSYVVGVLPTVTSVPANLAGELDARAANPQSAFNLTSVLIRGGVSARAGEGQRLGDSVLQRSGPALPLSPKGEPLGYANTYYPGTGNPDDATVIAIGSGESRDNVDVTVRFATTVTVSGMLMGPSGPMASVAVRLHPAGIERSSYDTPGSTQGITDGAGVFAIAGVMPGEYQASAAYSYGDDRAGAENISLWARTPISVGEESIAGLTLTMRPGVTFSGRVVFEGSADPVPPMEGTIPVFLQPAGATLWRSFPARVAPDGTFTSIGDPPGRYILNAYSPPGWSVQTLTLNGNELVDDLIEIGDRNVSGLVLTYSRIATRIAGTVSGVTGTTNPGTDVFVFSADGAAWREGLFATRRVRRVKMTSARTFEVSDMAPGEYYIAAVSTKLTGNWQTPEFLERLTAGATRITLAPKEQKTLNLSVITPRAR